MTNKEKYLARVAGKESDAITQTRWRVANRDKIRLQQSELLKKICSADTTIEK